ncbi:MAG: hypothetical protein R3F11_00545 [Verrucomicrobiales bacterium]
MTNAEPGSVTSLGVGDGVGRARRRAGAGQAVERVVDRPGWRAVMASA